jgi:predicted CXXCH cytochrome family protein
MTAIKRIIYFTIICVLFNYDVHAGIAVTKHNLSVSGTGQVRAVNQQDICIFCHIPHNYNPTQSGWNRKATGSYYTPYSSSTAIASPGQPNGASILCLSCHDGTIALGNLISEQLLVPMIGGITNMPNGPSLLGTDLSDDHPISFTYSWGLAGRRNDLVSPSELTGGVKLDRLGRMQCTSCHDPHDDRNGKFLTVQNRGGALCKTCHRNMSHWGQSSHNTSNAVWKGIGSDPWADSQWRTVSDNACSNCHQPHNAGGSERLLKYKKEEDNCILCHNGSVAKTDIAESFNKISRHPINETTGVHDPAEPAVINSRHVECVDCHNPHAATSISGIVAGPLLGVRGVSANGTEVASISADYELCFRCHGDGYNKPAPRTPRQIEQQNVREEFAAGNPSYHPVTTVGVNQNVPSLRIPYNTNSTIGCNDCHDSDDSSSSGGTGARGIHGSRYAPILSLRYDTMDNTTESPAVYALCYKCHDRNSILSDQSFKSHRLHVVDQKTSCNTCHDPHGISYTDGNSVTNSNLINFDISIVKENSLGNLRYESTGKYSGSCYLMCHGSDHAPQNY